jgi:branched-chain amino acid transport system ATP-binding protein
MENDILCTEKLSKDFGGLRALDNLDMVIEKGTIRGLIGPNGSGKTTFFNLISGLIPATSGTIYFENRDITNTGPDKILKYGIARTFQIPRLLPMMTCLENVMASMWPDSLFESIKSYFYLPFLHPKSALKQKKMALELLSFVGLSKAANHWGSSLVGMEMRLLQIARALASNPKLLLLDEPTAGMGDNEKKRFEEIVLQIKKREITIIIVEHDISLVSRISDAITCIDHGKKICEGTPEVVQRDKKVEEAYLGCK